MNTQTNSINSGSINSGTVDMIEGTDWTYADAAAMADECRREDRLFNTSRRTSRPRLNAAQRYARRTARFLAQTGWTLADAMNEAIEARRDARLYGPAIYAAI